MRHSNALRTARATLGVLAFVALWSGLDRVAAEPVVASGRSVTLLTASSLDPTCRSQGPVTINVIEPPRGGFLEVLQTKAYPNFNTLNSRSRCNTLKLPATQVIYQSAGNFLGADSVTLEMIFPGGNARRVHLPITVRPVTADFTPAPPPGAATLAPLAPAPSASAPTKKPVHHKKNALASATRHRPPCLDGCVGSGSKPTAVPKAPQGPTKDPLVNT